MSHFYIRSPSQSPCLIQSLNLHQNQSLLQKHPTMMIKRQMIKEKQVVTINLMIRTSQLLKIMIKLMTKTSQHLMTTSQHPMTTSQRLVMITKQTKMIKTTRIKPAVTIRNRTLRQSQNPTVIKTITKKKQNL